ncbi:ATP-binding protein [Lachnospiraceae bacterium 47-T17]
MFSKAISNILANAVAYTISGGTISVYIDGRDLIIENECLPIPSDHLKKIFEPFYRPDYARNRKDGGNGLGLYIVASILNYLHLSYSFYPMKEPDGMRFTISL